MFAIGVHNVFMQIICYLLLVNVLINVITSPNNVLFSRRPRLGLFTAGLLPPWLPAINDAGLGVVTSRGNKGHRMVDLSGIKINSLMNTVASAV